MKKLKIIFVFFPLLICIGNALNAQSKFVLNGKIQDKRSQIEKVYLDIQFPDRLIRDSVAVVNGKYVFKGKVEEPILAYLRASYRNKPAPEVVPVFLEPGVLTIIHQGMFSNLVVSGSQSHINFLPIFNTQSIIRKVSDSLRTAYSILKEKGDTIGMSALMRQYEDMTQKFRATYKDGLIANPRSPIAPFLLDSYSDNGWKDDVVDFDSLLSLLPSHSLNTLTGKKLLERQRILSSTRIGGISPDFVQNDTSGQPTRLSSFRGKYILLDFWAAWCVPCRKENLNYVQAYSRFKDQGLAIIGVSLDDNSEEWKAAINKDGLSWTNVSDLKGPENEAFLQFRGFDIPKNILIDPTGKIIAKDLFGDKLLEKLGEVFTNENFRK